MPGLTAAQITRWYKRGATRLEAETLVPNILQRLHFLEVHGKRWMRVDLERLARSERQPERVISLDSDEEEAAPDRYSQACDHHQCHAVACKQI